MNLYKISQDVNNSYDTYDSAVVCAENKEQAKMIHPYYGLDWDSDRDDLGMGNWCKVKQVKVEPIGIATSNLKPGSIICASFNAG